MTEKQYGGDTGRVTERTVINLDKKSAKVIADKNKSKVNKTTSKVNLSSPVSSDEEKIIKAGKIASETKKYAASIIKPGVPLLEIAEKIESKIVELGGKPAFPVNLSIDNIAAHYTPSHDDKTTAHGLLKVDIGVSIDGWAADTAFSVDLENSEENKKLIEASKKALENALKLIKDKIEKNIVKVNKDKIGADSNVNNNYQYASSSERILKESNQQDEQISTDEIGETIQKIIESFGFSPIINLSGHSMNKYELHAGITIPNINDKKNIRLKEGLYAIEPFATTGSGRVHDGKPSGIYELKETKNIRSPIAREVLEFIAKEYNTLPFCSRWIIKKLGTKALFGLKQLEDNGNIHHYSQLVEVQGSKVSQAEQTILIEKDKIIVTTE